MDNKNEILSQKFDNLNFSFKILHHKEFDNCTFTGCNFSEAVFSKCSFIDCQFIKCNLSIINLGYSTFSDVTFNECKMIGIDWTKASCSGIALYSPISFYKCIINDSSFFGLRLELIDIEKCKAHDVDFREGNFTKANFTYTDLLNSMFNNTNLTGANFTNSINYTINIYFNKIKNAKFSRYDAVRLLDCLEIKLID